MDLGNGRHDDDRYNYVSLKFSAARKQQLRISSEEAAAEYVNLQVRDIGSGNFGIARLMRDRATGELIAVKYIERGEKVLLASCYMSISSFTRFLSQLPPAQKTLTLAVHCYLVSMSLWVLTSKLQGLHMCTS